MKENDQDNKSVSFVIVANILPDSIALDETGTQPIIDTRDKAADALDNFNHPRVRRAIILKTLESKSELISFQTPGKHRICLNSSYKDVHSDGLLDFLTTAWSRWDALTEHGRDPGSSLDVGQGDGVIKPLIPTNMPLPRVDYQKNQFTSQNVMGQIGYYCTDMCTPITEMLVNELESDASIIQKSVSVSIEKSRNGGFVYALPTHPGHHAARDSFGGYCYLNQAAFATKLFQSDKYGIEKVAVLDIDYHCGNGTISIFHNDPNVLVASIHCDPNFEYPFHSGFADESSCATTLNIPLAPKTTWNKGYREALETALDKINNIFQAQAVVISMGLDTHEEDPCAIRRAGFDLKGTDYWEMGLTIASGLSEQLPVIFIQEGGYRMDAVGEAASNILLGFHRRRKEQQ